MKSRDDIIEKLSTLGDREREVLALVCQGVPYREIAEKLFISIGTVKSTMAHVYVKLEFDQVHASRRRVQLMREVCPILAYEQIPSPSDEDKALIVIPNERVERMVDEDERALIARPLASPVPVANEGDQGPSVIGRIIRILSVIGMVAVGVIVGGLILYFVLTGLLGIEIGAPASEPPTLTPTLSEGAAEEAAPLPADDEALPAAAATAEPTLTPTPEPSQTPLPTNTPRPTNTAVPTPTDTPLGMVDQVLAVSGEESDTEEGDGLTADPDSWTSTGIYVQEGDQLTIQYLGGEWWIGKVGDDEFIPQTPIDAGGYTGREEDRVVAEMQTENPEICYVIRSAPLASLIAKIGEEGPVFLVGNEYAETASLTGILHLRINYNSRVNFAFHHRGECPVSNGGEVSVKVQVIP